MSVGLFLYLLHNDYQNPHSTSKMGSAFLGSEAILAGRHNLN